MSICNKKTYSKHFKTIITAIPTFVNPRKPWTSLDNVNAGLQDPSITLANLFETINPRRVITLKDELHVDKPNEGDAQPAVAKHS